MATDGEGAGGAAPRENGGPGRGRGLARALALAGALLIVLFPVRAFLVLPAVPLGVRLCWPLAAIGAWLWPFPSLLAFVGASPLLPILPSLLGWPTLSIGEMWLFALLTAAGLRIAAGRRTWMGEVPVGQPILLALVTSSLVVTMYPFRLVHQGVWPLLWDVLGFLGGDFIVAASQRHLYASIVAWATVVEGLALLWLVVSGAGARPRACGVRLLFAAGVGSVLVASCGIVQRWTGWHLLPFWLQQEPDLYRINATFSDVNSLGAYLALMIWIVVAAIYARASRFWRWGWRAGAVAVVLALVFTGSRSAWVAAGVGAWLYAIGVWRFNALGQGSWLAAHMGRVLVTSALLLVITIGALTAFATATDVRHGDQRNHIDRVLYTLNLRIPIEDRLRGRMAMWEAAIRMIAARPVFGIGIGRYYKDVYRFTPRPSALIRPQENAHNYFLQIAAELGLAGVACFVALLLSGFAAVWRTAAGTADVVVRRYAIAAGAGICAFAAALLGGHSLLLRESQFALWPLIGAALLLSRTGVVGGEPPTSGRVARPPRRRLFVIAACLLILITVPTRAGREAARVNLAGTSSGLFEPETAPDGSTYQWTGERSVLHVPADAKAILLPLRSLAPFPQTVRILIGGRLADVVALKDHDWRNLRYLAPRSSGGLKYFRVELRVTPTWRSPGESRTRGVVVGRWSWIE
jgi:O-antigen ligase